jgi:outer membrane immunogenic protein
MKSKMIVLLCALGPVAPVFAGGTTEPIPEPDVVAAPVAIAQPSVDWSGFYAGAALGYGNVDSTGGALDGSGALGGVLAGYRYDFGSTVAGVELDYDTSDVNLNAGADSLDDVARLKLMAGYEFGRALVYGTVGAAQASATVGGVGLSDTGYFGGLGVDYAVTDRIGVGGELLQHSFDNFDGSGVDLDVTTVKARVFLQF